MTRLITLLILVVVALSVVALIDFLRTDRSHLPSPLQGAWAAYILLLPVLGAVAWFLAGRAPSTAAKVLMRGPVTAGGPIGPEDDPDFVRQMAEALRNL
jgi:drug/metabolite transporter (DMT)-like permease